MPIICESFNPPSYTAKCNKCGKPLTENDGATEPAHRQFPNEVRELMSARGWMEVDGGVALCHECTNS